MNAEPKASGASTVTKYEILNYKVSEYNLEKVWIRFENAGFEPILIKGWLAAQNYSEPIQRRYTDIDFIVSPEKYLGAVDFLERLQQKTTSIDLHSGAKILDTLSYKNLFDNTQLVKCRETLIRVLRPEDHLRILCVHWLNDGGAKKEKLWDIYYAVANRPKDFDWDRCLNSVSATRRKWIICAIGLAQKYLGLDLKDTPFENEIIEIPVWIIKTLEKEWESDTIIIPLHYCLNNKKKFFQQIKKRIPPNAIQATIEMEGEFDDKPRIFYQIGDIFLRLKPSVRRILKGFSGKTNKLLT